MSIAKITLFGMYKWMLQNEDDLFQFLTLPTGMNKDDLVDTILLRGGEFEVLYADPEAMQVMIKVWAMKMNHTFSRWVKALSVDYDPLENYDRREEWRDDKLNSGQIKGNNISSSEGNSTARNENKKSAFDSSDYSPYMLDESGNTSHAADVSQSETNSNGLESGTHTGRTHGNIGVTTSQQMLQAELDVARFNLYEEAANLFLMEFCIYTY